MPQRTLLPQHFNKRALSIEAATLHRLHHSSALWRLRFSHRRTSGENGIFLPRRSMKSINHVVCCVSKLSSESYSTRGNRYSSSSRYIRFDLRWSVLVTSSECIIFSVLKRSCLWREQSRVLQGWTGCHRSVYKEESTQYVQYVLYTHSSRWYRIQDV